MGKSKKNINKVPMMTSPSAKFEKKGKRTSENILEDIPSKKAKILAKGVPVSEKGKKKKSTNKKSKETPILMGKKLANPNVLVAPPSKPNKKAQSSSEEDESMDDEPAKVIVGKAPVLKVGKTRPAVNALAKVESKSDSEDESSEGDSEDESSEEEPVLSKVKSKAGVSQVGKSGSLAKAPAKIGTESEDDVSEDESFEEELMDQGSDSDDSDDEDDSEDDIANKGKHSSTKMKELESDEGSEDSDDDDNSEDEEPSPKKPKSAVGKGTKQAVQNGADRGAKSKPDKPGKQGGATGGSKTVFIKNLAWAVTEEKIHEFFGKDIAEVRLPVDDSGRLKGFGYVEFENEGAAKKALKKSGETFLGRDIFCDLARERSGQSGDWKSPQSGGNNSYSSFNGTPQSSRPAVDKTVFVKGFNKFQDEDSIREELRGFFRDCGRVDGIRIPTDRETGQIKGFAYVEFSSSDSSAKALELSGQELRGNHLVVDTASQRTGDSGGGRGRGGSGGRGFGGRGGRGGFRGGDRGRGGRGGRGGMPRQKLNLGASGRGKKTSFGD